jgi:hypothetical protein
MYLHYKLKVHKECRKRLVVYGTADNIITLSDLLLCLDEVNIEISDLYGNNITLENLRISERKNPVQENIADILEV